MKHMKNEHIQYVPQCKNEKSTCNYGADKCWFNHKENIEIAYKIARNSNLNQNSNVNKNIRKMRMDK